MRRSGLSAGLAAVLLALSAPAAAAVNLRRQQGDAATFSAITLHRGEQTPRVNVRKPVTDDRDYVHTTFDSGLRVMVVHDPGAKKAGFAVAVEAGSLEDPADFQGLAHFCEHMLFLGSEKYPNTEAFSNLLALHGGRHNAYTSSEETVYFNEIGDEGLEAGMDIFAQFFIAPSFAESMVDKEIHAVDSEHQKNKPDTQRRLWHLLRSRANPLNPAHQFATGDLQTLKTDPESHGKNLVEALKKFHSQHYCARRLHLVMVSNYSTEEQLAMAHRHFDAVPAATAASCPPRPEYTQFPLYSKDLGNIGKMFTVHTQGSPELWLSFPVEPLKHEYKKLSEAYLWNVLGHYGPGSLKAELMKTDLSQHYSYYAEKTVAGSVVMLTFQLTEKGAANPNEVLSRFFAYIAGVRIAGVNAELLVSIQKLRQVMFDYQEERSSQYDSVQSLAGSLGSCAPEDVLTAGVLVDQPDEAAVMHLLDKIVPTNMNLAMVSSKFDESKAPQHEPYYDFRYSEEPIDPQLMASLEHASGFGLSPPPNLLYVPQKLELITEEARPGGPEELVMSPGIESWWLGRAGIPLPQAIVNVKVGFPRSLLEEVHNNILSAMHARVVNNLLEQPADALMMCGLSFGVSSSKDGFGITFSGFDEHMGQLMAMVLPTVRTPGGSDIKGAFEQARRQLLLDLADITRLEPYQHAMEAFEVVTMKGKFSRAELLATAEDESKINVEAYLKLLDRIFDHAHAKVLITGNIPRQRSAELVASIAAALGTALVATHAPLSAAEARRASYEEEHSLVVKPSGPIEVRLPNPLPNDPNSATLVVYQFGVPTIEDRVHLAMLGEIIDRPVFEALRTDRQLGYVVFGYVAPHGSIVEVRVLVQGFREGPDVVEALVEEVVHNLTLHIERLPADEVAGKRRSLRTELERPPATLSEVAGQYWGQLWEGEHCFNKRARQLAVLDAADKSPEAGSSAPLLAAWKRAVAGEVKRQVVVKLFGVNSGNISVKGGAAVGALGPITLIDSRDIQARLKGEEYWPNEYKCT